MAVIDRPPPRMMVVLLKSLFSQLIMKQFIILIHHILPILYGYTHFAEEEMEHRERLSLTIPRLSVGYLLCAEFVFCSRVFLLQMEVSFLSLSSRELDLKKKKKLRRKEMATRKPTNALLKERNSGYLSVPGSQFTHGSSSPGHLISQMAD